MHTMTKMEFYHVVVCCYRRIYCWPRYWLGHLYLKIEILSERLMPHYYNEYTLKLYMNVELFGLKTLKTNKNIFKTNKNGFKTNND